MLRGAKRTVNGRTKTSFLVITGQAVSRWSLLLDRQGTSYRGQRGQHNAASTISDMWGACPEEVDVCYGVRDHGRFTEDLTGDPGERRTPARDPAEGAESGASPLPAATGGGESGVTWE